MNATGALVRTGASLTPGTYVYVRTKDLGLMGSALVRHIDADLPTYRIGLQFSGWLTTKFLGHKPREPGRLKNTRLGFPAQKSGRIEASPSPWDFVSRSRAYYITAYGEPNQAQASAR